ncbi:MAG: 4Fe-4S cluster-binding domain-containing protein [Candidatus Aenigmarchaeota archaeon]|nr:4Fe-4S cluster-binding domain-containing protein [Candidatus Aenigmarchaeota archaeon]
MQKGKRIYCALGYKCNNNCLICAVDSATKQDKNISTQEICNFLDNFSGKHEIEFEISGGEATLRSDFLYIMDYIRKNNPKSPCILLSNGRRFSDTNFTSHLSEIMPQSTIIAIHGNNSNMHDAQTQIKGSFIETISGVSNLFDFGFNVDLKAIVTKLNYKKLPEIIQFAAQTFPDLKYMSINGLDVQGAAETNKNRVFIPMSSQKNYIQKAIDMALNYDIAIRTYSFPFCLFDEDYRKFVGFQPQDNVTCKSPFVEKENLLPNYGPVEKCSFCKYVSVCGGTWHSYYSAYGVDELSPVLGADKK